MTSAIGGGGGKREALSGESVREGERLEWSGPGKVIRGKNRGRKRKKKNEASRGGGKTGGV